MADPLTGFVALTAIFLGGVIVYAWGSWRAKRDGAAIDAMMAERRAKKRRGA